MNAVNPQKVDKVDKVEEDACLYCFECGKPIFMDDNDVTYHGTPGDIDYDADEDHTPYGEEEQS